MVLLFQLISPGIGIVADAESMKSEDSDKIKVEQLDQKDDAITWKVTINATSEENDGTKTKITTGSGHATQSINNVGDANVEVVNNGYMVETPAGSKTYNVEIMTTITDANQSPYVLHADTTVDDNHFKASNQIQVEAKVEEEEVKEEVKQDKTTENVEADKKETDKAEEVKKEAEDEKGVEAPVKQTESEKKDKGAETDKPVKEPAEKDEEEQVGEKSLEIMPMAIGAPGYYYTDPGAIVVPTELQGQSTNVHTKPMMLWANGDKVYVAVKLTHEPQYMELNGARNVSFERYDPWVPIYVDDTKHEPKDLNGNTKDSHWTVFEFNMEDLNLNDDGMYPFFVKGIGGGHDVGGYLLFKIPKVDVEAKKVWVGGTERPAITLQLMASSAGETPHVLKTGVVDGSETPAWTYTWTDVPEYDPYGRKYTFTADEETVPVNYTKSIDGLIVTNTYDPEMIDIPVNKEWIGPAAESVTFTLFADGKNSGQTITLQAPDWSGAFTGLNKYDDKTGNEIVYTIEELNIPGYTSEVTGSAEDGFTFTNTNDETIDIDVEKKWIGPGKDSVTIKLFADGKEVEELVLNADNEWSGQFKDLRKYDAKTGEEIVYTAQEVAITGYTTKQSGSVDEGFTFTNINDATVQVEVEKKWIGPAADSVTIKLFADGADTGKTLELTAETEWKGMFINLRKYDEQTGKEIAYSVEEVAIPGYSSETTGTAEDGFVVTNTNDETIDVDVEKKWIGPKTDSVSVQLLANGVATGDTITLNEGNNWFDSFKNVRKYDATSGEEISYTVEEIDVPENYDVDITKADGKFIITNTARFGSLTVEKVDENGEPLAGATFELKDSNGNVFGPFTTKGDGIITFEELEWGDYTLTETKAPEGYNKLTKGIKVTINGEHLHITEQVKNTPQGWDIPNTGGIGTLGFYGVGFILMAGAGWLVFRRRSA